MEFAHWALFSRTHCVYLLSIYKCNGCNNVCTHVYTEYERVYSLTARVDSGKLTDSFKSARTVRVQLSRSFPPLFIGCRSTPSAHSSLSRSSFSPSLFCNIMCAADVAVDCYNNPRGGRHCSSSSDASRKDSRCPVFVLVASTSRGLDYVRWPSL